VPPADGLTKSIAKITSIMSGKTYISSSNCCVIDGATVGEFQVIDCPATGRRLHSPKLYFGGQGASLLLWSRCDRMQSPNERHPGDDVEDSEEASIGQ
jgi:hypothetical protein